MSPKEAAQRPHAVLIPQPAQGHVTPMLHLAKALHARGFHITYVNSEYNHRRLLRSRGPASLAGAAGFRFEAVPDGLPPSDNDDVTQDIAALCLSTTEHSAAPFRDLLARLNATPGAPPVSCVVADGVMSFAQRVAEEMGIRALVFWTRAPADSWGTSTSPSSSDEATCHWKVTTTKHRHRFFEESNSDLKPTIRQD